MDVWSINAVLIAAFVIAPILSVFIIALTPKENIWPHLLSTTLPRYASNTLLLMIFVGIFGFCHGTAHGLEMPWASNPILFALGFASGTAILHLFGVGIGLALIRNNFLNIILRALGFACALFGFYLII